MYACYFSYLLFGTYEIITKNCFAHKQYAMIGEQFKYIMYLNTIITFFQGTIVGIVRGSGNQTLGAIIIFVSYYLIGLPVGVPLMFLTYLGQAGMSCSRHSVDFQ